jgi:DNA-binding transcriptional regulator YhcF (GntR family)
VSPAINKALRWLIDALEDRTFEQGQRLPRIADAAHKAGVSLASMHKAFAILKDKGIIRTQQGKRAVVGAFSPGDLSELSHGLDIETRPPPAETPRPWQRLAQRITHDIISGTYEPGQKLPVYKELIHRYATSYHTLKKALSHLHAQGDLLAYKDSYRTRDTDGTDTSRYRIGLITICSEDKKMVDRDVSEKFVQAVESLCIRMGMSIELFMYDPSSDPLTIHTFTGAETTLKNDPHTLGYIQLVLIDDDNRDRIMQTLTHFQKPLAVIDVIGGWSMPRLAHSTKVRIFHNTVSKRCGYDMARYLYELGHRHLAYISPVHDNLWSRHRLNGIQDAARTYGLSLDPVVEHRTGSITSAYKDEAWKHCDVGMLQETFARWKKAYPRCWSPQLQHIFDISIPSFFIPRTEFRNHLYTLIDKTLSQSRATAWILANDTIARWTLDYLHDKGVSVPRDISVVGFDNTTEAFRTGLTSYDFNMSAMAHQALDFLQGRNAYIRRASLRPITVKGTVIPRTSTRRISEV